MKSLFNKRAILYCTPSVTSIQVFATRDVFDFIVSLAVALAMFWILRFSFVLIKEKRNVVFDKLSLIILLFGLIFCLLAIKFYHSDYNGKDYIYEYNYSSGAGECEKMQDEIHTIWQK